MVNLREDSSDDSKNNQFGKVLQPIKENELNRQKRTKIGLDHVIHQPYHHTARNFPCLKCNTLKEMMIM